MLYKQVGGSYTKHDSINSTQRYIEIITEPGFQPACCQSCKHVIDNVTKYGFRYCMRKDIPVEDDMACEQWEAKTGSELPNV
jgi:hypothetical protein